MASLVSFAALYTEEGQSSVLDATTKYCSSEHMPQYLGLKQELRAWESLFHGGIVNTFVEDLNNTVHDFMSASGIIHEHGRYGDLAAKLKEEPSFIAIAEKMGSEYGPLLWGHLAREHLYKPSEVTGYKDLYWARPRDAELIQFLIRCWLVRLAYIHYALKAIDRTGRLLEDDGMAGGAYSATNGLPNGTPTSVVQDGDSDDLPPNPWKRRFGSDDAKSQDGSEESEVSDERPEDISDRRASPSDSVFSDLVAEDDTSLHHGAGEHSVPRLLQDLRPIQEAQEREQRQTRPHKKVRTVSPAVTSRSIKQEPPYHDNEDQQLQSRPPIPLGRTIPPLRETPIASPDHAQKLQSALFTFLQGYSSGTNTRRDTVDFLFRLDSGQSICTPSLKSYFGDEWTRAENYCSVFVKVMAAWSTFKHNAGYHGKPDRFFAYLERLGEGQQLHTMRERVDMRERMTKALDMPMLIGLPEEWSIAEAVAWDVSMLLVKLIGDNAMFYWVKRKLELVFRDVLEWIM